MPIQNLPNATPTIPLLPYYVYVLIDPSDQTVFYCGKGQGSRAKQHVAGTQQLLNNGLEPSGRKTARIATIIERGERPLEVVIGRYETEDEAFAVEATLIKWVYGAELLTNAVAGHGSEWIRARGALGEAPGIDIPVAIRSTDGTYRNAKIAALASAGAFDFAERLREQLLGENFQIRDFSANEDRAYDPGTSNGWLGIIVRIHQVDLLVSFSHTCKAAISIANTGQSRSEAGQEQLLRIAETLGPAFHAGAPKNIKVNGEGRYRDFDQKLKFNRGETNEALSQLIAIRNVR